MTSLDDPADVTALIERSINTSVPETFGAYLFIEDDPATEIARSVERSVFLEAFGNTADLLAHEYGPYDASSLFACVIDHRALRPAGVIRLIVPKPGGPGLKSLNDVAPVWGSPAATLLERAGVVAAPGRMWDAATLAVAPAYRTAAATGLVSLALYQSMVTAARAAGAEWLCALLDGVVFRVANAKFAGPFESYGEPRSYLGSAASLPVTVNLARWQAQLAAHEPEIHDIIYLGTGLEPVLRSVPVAVAESVCEVLLSPGSPGAASRPRREEATVRGVTRAERAR